METTKICFVFDAQKCQKETPKSDACGSRTSNTFLEDIERLRESKKNSLNGSQLFSGARLFHVDDLSVFEALYPPNGSSNKLSLFCCVVYVLHWLANQLPFPVN